MIVAAAGLPYDEVERKKNLLRYPVRMMDSFLHSPHGCTTNRMTRLVDGGQRHGKKRSVAYVVKSDNTNIAWQRGSHVRERPYQLRRGLVIGANHGIRHGRRDHLSNKIHVRRLAKPGESLCLRRQPRSADGLSATCQAEVGGRRVIWLGEKAKVAVSVDKKMFRKHEAC